MVVLLTEVLSLSLSGLSLEKVDGSMLWRGEGTGEGEEEWGGGIKGERKGKRRSEREE